MPGKQHSKLKKTKRPTQLLRSEVILLFKRSRAVVTGAPIEIRLAKIKRTAVQLLIVVPRAVGNAVVRNTVKRRIKALMQPLLPSMAHYGILVLVKKGAGDLSFSQIQEIFTPLLQKIAHEQMAPRSSRNQ